MVIKSATKEVLLFSEIGTITTLWASSHFLWCDRLFSIGTLVETPYESELEPFRAGCLSKKVGPTTDFSVIIPPPPASQGAV
jgi:hypothetical protein